MLSKLETGGGGGGSNWSAKNDPYKYAAGLVERLPSVDSLHLRFRSKFKRGDVSLLIIPARITEFPSFDPRFTRKKIFDEFDRWNNSLYYEDLIFKKLVYRIKNTRS